MLKKIKQLLRIDSYFDKIARNTYDSSASILLHKLFPSNVILSFTPFSLNPNTILHLINEIQINKRKEIIEFGSGISTIVLAKFIKDNNLKSKIVSIEDNKGWFEYVSSELIKYDLQNNVELYYVPLKKGLDETEWYDKEIILEIVKNRKFDLIIVDGPSAKLGEHARKPAVELLVKSLEDTFIVFLDDIRRKGERRIIDDWEETLIKNNYKVKKEISKFKVYGTIKCGICFSSTPLSH